MVSYKWILNMLSANMALILVCWGGYTSTMDGAVALWQMNVCQFMLGKDPRQSMGGLTELEKGQVVKESSEEMELGKFTLYGNKEPFFKIDGIEKNGTKGKFSLIKINDLRCSGLTVHPDLTSGPRAGIFLGSAWGAFSLFLIPCGIMFLQAWKFLSSYPYNSVGYVVLSQDIPKLPMYKRAYRILWALVILQFFMNFALPPAMGAPGNAYVQSLTDLFTFYTMLKELYTPVHTAVPIGRDAWEILIPNMKFYHKPSIVLEEIEDGLLQLTVAKANGKPGEGMETFIKLGISEENAEKILASVVHRNIKTMSGKNRVTI